MMNNPAIKPVVCALASVTLAAVMGVPITSTETLVGLQLAALAIATVRVYEAAFKA